MGEEGEEYGEEEEEEEKEGIRCRGGGGRDGEW